MYHLLVGRTVGGRYEVRDLLGRGGMGAVYRAHDATLHRDVAVKVIAVQAADASEEEALRRRFHREARLSARLRHPNVVAIHDFVRDEALGIDGIVMELLEGEDLAQRVARAGPLPLDEGLDVLAQAVRGIAAGHRAGLLHRDVKPPNLFLASATGRGRTHVHVLDFGIAQESAPAEGTSTHLTAFGRTPLSPRFASPEQWRGNVPLTPASDVFSLAMTGWFALAGEPPFTVEQLQEAAASGRLPPLRVPAGWPFALESLFRRALAADPAARFPDAEAMEAALDAARGGLPGSATTAVPLPPPAPPKPTPPRYAAPAPPPVPPRPRPVRVDGRPARRRGLAHPARADESFAAWMSGGLLLLLLGLTAAPRLIDRLGPGAPPPAETSGAASDRPISPEARAEPPRAAYSMEELDEPPVLREASARALLDELERSYPTELQAWGIGGTVRLRMLLLEDGSVDPATVEVLDSTRDEFVAPSVGAASRLRYEPGRIGGAAVKVWVEQPITWRPWQ